MSSDRSPALARPFLQPLPWAALITVLSAGAATRWWPISTAASLLLLTWLPGRLVLGRLGLLSGTSTGTTILLSASLSLALSPVPLDWLWRCTHNGWAILGVWWAALLVVACSPRLPRWPQRSSGNEGTRLPADAAGQPLPLFEHRRTRLAAVIVGAWLALAITLTYWPSELLGYPLPAGPHDYIKHHAVLDSLQRRALPLGNVFFAGPDQKIYYYHLFYLAPATLRLWADRAISIDLAFAIYSAAVALAMVGLVYLLTKRLAGAEAPATLAAVAASLLGGLDLLPVLVCAARRQFMVTLDAWADLPFRIHNFYTQMVWCPQHMLGLVIVLTAAYLLSRRPQARWWLVLGPMLAASLVGSTVYLAVAVAASAPVWALVMLWRARGDRVSLRRLAGAYLLILIVTFGLTLPQVLGYAEMAGRHEDGLTTDWPRYNYALLGRLVSPGPVANLLDLPWMLLLEYGLRFACCFLVAAAFYRRVWRDAGLCLLAVSSVAGLGAFVTFRSSIHLYDYSFKIGLFPSMALTAMLAGCVVSGEFTRPRLWNPLGWQLPAGRFSRYRRFATAILAALVVASLPVGFYEAPVTAVRRFVEQTVRRNRLSPAEYAPIRDEHEAWRFLRHNLPPDAVVQCHPAGQRLRLVQVVRRQFGVMNPSDPDVQVFRPADIEAMQMAFRDVLSAGRARSAAETHSLLSRHCVTHVFVGPIETGQWQHLDRFQDRQYFRPLFQRPGAQVYELVRPP